NGDSIFIELINFGEVDVPDNSLLALVKKKNEVVYFLASECENALKFTDFDFNPLVIPLKIRPAIGETPLQFFGDVAIGPYFGYQLGKSSFTDSGKSSQVTVTFCAFGSPTMINLNQANQTDASLQSNSVLGLSAGSGILFDLNNIQFGIIGGWDWISGTASKTWIYQSKIWTSFSFAYNLTK